MEIFITRKAQEELAALPQHIGRQIKSKILHFMRYRDPLVFAKRLANESTYRWRSGNYRVFFERQGNALFVVKIARRDEAYD